MQCSILGTMRSSIWRRSKAVEEQRERDWSSNRVNLEMEGNLEKKVEASDLHIYKNHGEEGGEVVEFRVVLRMWEGEFLDCFEDRRIAIESPWMIKRVSELWMMIAL